MPHGIVIQEAELPSDGTQALVSRCAVAADIRCSMDGMRYTDTLTLELGHHAVAEGTHRLDYGLSIDGAPFGDVAATRIEHVSSVAALQALIDAAQEGDTVVLPPGRYDGTLDGPFLEVDVVGAEGPERTALVSIDPAMPLLRRPGSRSTWRNLELRTSGAPLSTTIAMRS